MLYGLLYTSVKSSWNHQDGRSSWTVYSVGTIEADNREDLLAKIITLEKRPLFVIIENIPYRLEQKDSALILTELPVC